VHDLAILLALALESGTSGPLNWTTDVPANVAANVVALALGVAIGWLYRKVTNQRIWSFADETKVVVYIAESARKVVTKTRAPSGAGNGPSEQVSYVRSATGVGQVRALAAVAPSLRTAYRKLDLEKIRMASEGLGGDQKCDLITLGGVKNSARVTGAVLAELDRRFELHGSSNEDWLSWRDDRGDVHDYEAEGNTYERRDEGGQLIQEREIQRDYGLIIKAPNPWNTKTTVVIFAGASTYGTAAAATFFATQRRWRRPKYFEALVEVGVTGGHSGDPQCLHLTKLQRRPRA
jgi:hypothetical protein